jgi:hypothetical protein
MTEMLSEADNPSHGLMPWVGKCCVKWINENCERIHNDVNGALRVTKGELQDAQFAYKTVSQEALDIGSEVHSMIEEFFNEPTS